MRRIPQGRYSKGFRVEAVKPVLVQEMKVPEVSRRIDIPKSTISNWVRVRKEGKLGGIGKDKQLKALTNVESKRL